MNSLSNASRHVEQDSPASAEQIILRTVDAVAKQLSVSRSKVYALIDSGKLAAHRLPAIRVSDDQIQEFLDGCRSQPPSSLPRTQTIKLKHLR